MKILTIIGARPQFVKVAALSYVFKKYQEIDEIILHTGQHYDSGMSDVFFEELEIAKPKYNLNLGGLSHGAMTGRMMEQIENVCIQEKPDLVLVFGDTNSTIAGALAAKKIHIKVAHVEAGLRSFNMSMPEEINRILTDRISDYLFCPTNIAVSNLKKEGLESTSAHVVLSGDVMNDALKIFGHKSVKPSVNIKGEFILCTLHRAENTDSPEKLSEIVSALNTISEDQQIILPLHPRTRKIISDTELKISANLTIIEPVSYFEMIYLLQNCSLVMTDSGGLQKEAYFLSKPCITLREETEWVELVENGYNLLAGSSFDRILKAYAESKNFKLDFTHNFYGDGIACEIIAQTLLNTK
jgi:UDP-GlcNAc3NAcA epimerase